MVGTKVVIIDDDPDILKIGELSLTGIAKWQVSTASSSKEAFMVLNQAKPDLILLDTALPDIDGLSLMEKIRENQEFANTPVVLTTTRIEPGEEDFYISKGATGLIEKPFNPETLVDQLVEKVNA